LIALCGYLVCLFLSVPRWAVAESQPVDCHVCAPRVGRVFFAGEPVTLTVTSASASQTVRYAVYDADGRTVASGSLRLDGGTPQSLALRQLGIGIYYLTFTFADNSQFKDAFCVVPRPDDGPGDPGLWGFQFGAMYEQYYAFMAALGVRHVRFDLSWPDHERTPGAYGFDVADWYASCLKRYGLQMIPTLGYTPGWTAMQPEDLGPERSHVFAPDAVEHWAQFVSLLGRRLGEQTVTWPPSAVVGGSKCQMETLPLVRSWEIWNEVDQNYYWGHWGRYLDLLRVAGAVLKQQDPRRSVAYGGSCGHWTELAKTYEANCVPYFDQLTWHSGGNMERELPKYYYGAPQLGYRNWLPRPTIQTECYPDPFAGASEAESVLRLYTILKAWREEGYSYASIGQHLIGPADPNSCGLGWWTADGQIAPTAKGVAYASARWLLMDATYVGPLNLGANVVAHLFMKRGSPLLIAWCDGGATVSVNLSSRCRRFDALGRETPVRGTRVNLALTPAPVVLWGVAEAYVPAAISAYVNQVMKTEYGFPYGTDSPYVHTLEADCDWNNPGQAARLAATLSACVTALSSRPTVRGRALDPYALDLRTAICNLTSAAQRWGMRPEVPTTVWRLVRLAEWVGEVSDALDPTVVGRPSGVEMSTNTGVTVDLQQARAVVADDASGRLRPMSATLLSRAQRMSELAARTGGPGAALAVRTAMEAARQYATLEGLSQIAIFAVGYFPTAHQLKKGVIFDPDTTHTVQAQVYNFTAAEVSGTLTWHFGDTWSPQTASVQFSAPANGWSERLSCQVTIPGGAQPWPIKTASNPAGSFSVYCPAEVPVGETLILDGCLSDGRPLLPMRYEVSVGVRIP
jgi:hypothetical protein